MILVLALLSAVICSAAEQASDTVRYRAGRWFQYVPYGHSLYADVHPDYMRLDLGAVSLHPETNFGGSAAKYSVQMLSVFGGRISIWNIDLQDRRFGLNVSQGISAHLWMDISEHTTSPIVNMDYRVGVPTFTFIHRLQGRESVPFLKNYSIQICPFKHESTHIGDEMVLQRNDKGYALRRVNVSYNFMELNVTLNEPEDRFAMAHTFRLGALVLLSPKHGWYWLDTRDGDVNNIASNHPMVANKNGLPERYGPGGMPFELWLQYQFQSAASKHGFQAVVSAEVRNRALYGYSLTETAHADAPRYSAADSHRFTYSLFAGARYNTPHYGGYFSRIAVGVRAYHGNCPFGMFRSVNNFSHIGICVVYQ